MIYSKSVRCPFKIEKMGWEIGKWEWMYCPSILRLIFIDLYKSALIQSLENILCLLEKIYRIG